MTKVLRKTVNVIPQVPFPLKQIINRPMYNVDMCVGDIRVCILKRAIVQEVLPNGRLLNLNLGNYDTLNFKDTSKVDIEEPKEEIKVDVVKEDNIVTEINEDLIPEEKEEAVTEIEEHTQIEPQYQRKNKKRR